MTEPYYADNHVTLYCGDMRELLPALTITPDLVIADPPYGETNLTWDRWPHRWPAAAVDVCRSMWCFGSMRTLLKRHDEIETAGWRLSQDVVWRKQNGTGFAADRFRRVHEHVTHWYVGDWQAIHHTTPRVSVGAPNPSRTVGQGKGHTRHLGAIDKGEWVDDGTRLTQSVIEAANMWRRGAIAPTQKPVELLNPLIVYGCPPGGLVLDPFAGSASTGVAARDLGMRAVLIEADEAMCERAARRLSQPALPLETVAAS